MPTSRKNSSKTKSKAKSTAKTKPKTGRERMQARRDRLRAQGLRPVQHWVPDLRDPKVLADFQREIAQLSKHPENDAIDAWIEQVTDFSEWK